MRYTVKNWAKFQHYTGRRPPWIKLYRDLLDNYEFMSLSLASKALAPLCWLLASESDDGSFDGEIDRLAFRLRVDSKALAECLNELIEKGFIEGASVVLAECRQLATPETERETETETEGKKRATRFAPPDWVPVDAWNGWIEVRRKNRWPVTDRALALAVGELEALRGKGHDPSRVIDLATLKGWRSFYPPKDAPPKLDDPFRGVEGYAR